MPLNDDQQAYLVKHNLKRLSFDGVNDLYQTRHGAHTIERAMELDAVHARFGQAMRQQKLATQHLTPVSAELEARNERCIDRFGCGMY